MRTPTLLCLLVLVLAYGAVRAGEKRVSIDAEGARLGDLLKELADIGPVEQMLFDQDVEDARVTLSLESTPFSEAMIEVLQAASFNYVLQGGNGNPYQVYAGPRARPEAGHFFYEEADTEFDEDEGPLPEISGGTRDCSWNPILEPRPLPVGSSRSGFWWGSLRSVVVLPRLPPSTAT